MCGCHVKVTKLQEEGAGDAADTEELMANVSAALSGGEEEDDDGLNELVIIEEEFYYLNPIIRMLALLHSLVAFSMLVAYYCLKVIQFFEYL